MVTRLHGYTVANPNGKGMTNHGGTNYDRAMILKEAMAELEALGEETMRAHNAKYGAGKNQFGVKMGDIRAVAKKIKSDHGLALALWKTGNLDAQFLATLVIQAKNLSAEEMDRMVRSVTFAHVANWLDSYVVREHPDREGLR